MEVTPIKMKDPPRVRHTAGALPPNHHLVYAEEIEERTTRSIRLKRNRSSTNSTTTAMVRAAMGEISGGKGGDAFGFGIDGRGHHEGYQRLGRVACL